MSALNFATLRAKAEAATDDWYFPSELMEATDNEADAAYIAAADPQTILRLLDRLARAECKDHNPNTGPGSDWCPNCRQYEPALAERQAPR